MKAFKPFLLAGLILSVVAPGLAVTYTNDFMCTKQTWVGRALYDSNTNYGTRRFGRVAKGEQDVTIMDFDRQGIFTYVQDLYTAFGKGPLTSANQLNQPGSAVVTMYLELTAYDSWEETGAPYPPTVFGHMFWPGVRLSAGQNWDELTATFNNAAGPGNPWHDALGNAIANIYVNKYDTHANMVMNSTSQTWGQADGIGAGSDYYNYDITRPWKLDDSVAWAGMANPAAVGFNMVHDMYNRPWALQTDGTYLEDDCNGSIYGRLHDFPPFIRVEVNITGVTYWSADFNHSRKVDFADYLILEANFGKSGMTNGQGDCAPLPGINPPTVYDGVVNFADYLQLEAQFGKTTPEPATIGLLLLGGLVLSRRRQ